MYLSNEKNEHLSSVLEVLHCVPNKMFEIIMRWLRHATVHANVHTSNGRYSTKEALLNFTLVPLLRGVDVLISVVQLYALVYSVMDL